MSQKATGKPPSTTPPRAFVVVPLIAAAIAVLALPFAAISSGSSAPDSSNPRQRSDAQLLSSIKPSDQDLGKFLNNNTGSQVSYTRLSDNFHTGSANERFTRPALSLAKLYIAEEVFRSGDEEQKKQAEEMIRTSDDAIAEKLYKQFPTSIDDTAERYDLYSTRSASDHRWGYSVTSSYDLVSFISQKLREDPNDPLLEAMREAAPVAADGYKQDFGTAKLRGATGTKWGWSNDHSLNSSVSFGPDFVAAAAVAGSAQDLSDLVINQLGAVNARTLAKDAASGAQKSASASPSSTAAEKSPQPTAAAKAQRK